MSTRRDRERKLFVACEAGDVERVRRVIADGVDPKKTVDEELFNETPVHTACRLVQIVTAQLTRVFSVLISRFAATKTILCMHFL